MKSFNLTLPFPPSVNHYWRHVTLGKRRATLISREGRRYRNDVAARVLADLGASHRPVEGRLAVSIHATMPDRRQRDIDNLLKSTLDALTNAGVWGDDGQIDTLSVSRGIVAPPGNVVVTIDVISSDPRLF